MRAVACKPSAARVEPWHDSQHHQPDARRRRAGPLSGRAARSDLRRGRGRPRARRAGLVGAAVGARGRGPGDCECPDRRRPTRRPGRAGLRPQRVALSRGRYAAAQPRRPLRRAARAGHGRGGRRHAAGRLLRRPGDRPGRVRGAEGRLGARRGLPRRQPGGARRARAGRRHGRGARARAAAADGARARRSTRPATRAASRSARPPASTRTRSRRWRRPTRPTWPT